MELLKHEKTEQSTVTCTVKVSKEDFAKATDKAFAQKSKTINIPGFRKGKAPRNIIEKMYGKDIFVDEAINNCYPEAYDLAVEKSKITPIAKASVDVTEFNEEGLTFSIVFPVYPEIKLGTYKGLSAPKEEITKVDAATIKAELENMAQKLSRIESVTRKVKKGDTVNFDFDGYVDGKQFDGGKADGFDLVIGSGQFIPGFEEQLIGTKTGDAKDVEVSFPEDYHATELAGKPAVFKCQINNVKQTITPKIDDEFAKDVSEFDTLEQLKKDVSTKIIAKMQETANNVYEDLIMDKLVENMTGDIPQAMFDNQSDRVVEDFAYRIQMQGMNMDQYLKMNGMDMESFRKLFTPQAEKQVKIKLALEGVATAEGLKVDAKDIKKQYEDMAKAYNMEVDKIKDAVSEEALKGDLLINKAVEFVMENAKSTKATKPKAEKTETAEKPAAKKATPAKTTKSAPKKEDK